MSMTNRNRTTDAVIPKMPKIDDLPDRMARLSKYKRLFAWAWAHNGCRNDLALIWARKQLGWKPVAQPRAESARLVADKNVLAALRELAVFQFDALTLPAIQALAPIIANPQHKQHFKAVEFVLNRSGFHEKQMHEHVVTHKLEAKDLDAKLLVLTAALGIKFQPPPAKALAAPVEDAEFEEIDDAPQSEADTAVAPTGVHPERSAPEDDDW